MANALKCDRCGKFYEHYMGIKLVDKGAYYCSMSLFSERGCNRRDFDICRECMTKLVEFMKNEEER